MTAWVAASVALKVLIYLAAAAGIGGGFSLLLIANRGQLHDRERLPGARGVKTACALGVPAAIGYFLVRVGDFAAEGIAGMVDPLYVQLLWESPVGSTLQVRLIGIALLLVALAGPPPQRGRPGATRLACRALCYAVGALMTAASFNLTGHSAELGTAGSLLVTAHVAAALCWAGALYPLWFATSSLDVGRLQQVLHRFGVLAAGLVAVVLLAGSMLLFVILSSQAADMAGYYIAAMAFKMALVITLLLIAAHHKWRSVPRLERPGGLDAFRRSLRLECAVVLVIVMATAVLSTVLGPFHSA